MSTVKMAGITIIDRSIRMQMYYWIIQHGDDGVMVGIITT